MYSIISDFCETEIVKLRERDTKKLDLLLMSDLGEAHSKKVIKLCSKYGMVKQTTAGYTPQVNAFAERYFRTNGEMSRSSRKMQENMATSCTTEYHHLE